MTVRLFIHSAHKHADTTALVDSGATENFLNLKYARWLKLPVKWLAEPRKLYNVDGSLNKGGDLRFYTNLSVRTGPTQMRLCFFLTELGDHKAILGYPWFAAVQPNIDWKRGWIDHSQLPIILCAPDAQKAQFLARGQKPIISERYYIGQVTIKPTTVSEQLLEEAKAKIPEEYSTIAMPASSVNSIRIYQPTWCGTMLLNSYQGHPLRSQGDSSHSPKKKSQNAISSSRNISHEELSTSRKVPTQPTSS